MQSCCNSVAALMQLCCMLSRRPQALKLTSNDDVALHMQSVEALLQLWVYKQRRHSLESNQCLDYTTSECAPRTISFATLPLNLKKNARGKKKREPEKKGSGGRSGKGMGGMTCVGGVETFAGGALLRRAVGLVLVSWFFSFLVLLNLAKLVVIMLVTSEKKNQKKNQFSVLLN
jgi:hypothetical protein